MFDACDIVDAVIRDEEVIFTVKPRTLFSQSVKAVTYVGVIKALARQIDILEGIVEPPTADSPDDLDEPDEYGITVRECYCWQGPDNMVVAACDPHLQAFETPVDEGWFLDGWS